MMVYVGLAVGWSGADVGELVMGGGGRRSGGTYKDYP